NRHSGPGRPSNARCGRLMRSVILVIFSAIALAGLFVGYWVLQPVTPVSVKMGKPPAVRPVPKSTEAASAIGIRSGESPWLRKFDAKGEVSTLFKGEQYHPRPNGTIDVIKPIAKFYLANHQRIEIEGARGNVVVKEQPGAGKSGFGGGGLSA